MASSYDKINRREEVNELFEQLGQVLDRKVQVLLIGGAVLLEQGLKDSTKDIDVVCRNENDKRPFSFLPEDWDSNWLARRRDTLDWVSTGWL